MTLREVRLSSEKKRKVMKNKKTIIEYLGQMRFGLQIGLQLQIQEGIE